MPRTNPQLTIESTFQGVSIPLMELTELLDTARRTLEPSTATVSVSMSRADRPGESTVSTITISGSPANSRTSGPEAEVPR